MGLLVLLSLAAALLFALATAAVVHKIRHPRRRTLGAALARGLPGDPADMDLPGREITFTFSDGVSAPGWIIAGSNPAGPTVVVVHGFGDSRFGALTWAPLFMPHAAHIVVYDQRAHGDSTARVSTLGIREPDDVLAVIDQLDADVRAAGVVLFGYSFGAGVAIAAAAHDDVSGRKIRGVIADGPYRHWQEPAAVLLRKRRYPHQPTLFLADLVLRLLQPGLATFDRVAHARRLRAPLLVLHGKRDELCPYDAACAISEAAPEAEMITFEEGCHLDLARCDPVRYRDALARFFAQLSPNPESR